MKTRRLKGGRNAEEKDKNILDYIIFEVFKMVKMLHFGALGYDAARHHNSKDHSTNILDS